MLSMLDRKLLREIARNKAQTFAIVMVVASGVAVFVMSVGVLGFLRSTRDAYYDRYRFADLFAPLVRAPEPVAEQLRSLDGVARVQTRIVADVTLDVPSLAEPAVGRLVSLPDQGDFDLNAIALIRGRWPASSKANEVVASEAFMVANRLRMGDTVKAVINGRYEDLAIVGIGLSPEYVFQIRGGDLLPDDRRFGVFWMRREGLEAAMDMDGAFNDVSLKLLKGFRTEEMISQVDEVLRPYGGVGAIDRTDQISARFLDDEIKQLRATGLIAPIIFLGVAAFLLNVVVSRRVQGDRESLAALRAFGYSGFEIAWHYLKTALIIVVLGAALGVLVGQWMGRGLATIYADFYRFPEFVYRFDPWIAFPAVAISILAAILGALVSIGQVLSLQPADAMRPPVPMRFGPSLIERLGLGVLFPLTWRMILRQLGRRRIASLFTVLGISSAVAVMVLSGFAPDALDYLLDFQFHLVQRQDIQFTLKDIHSPNAIDDLRKMPGVRVAEPFRGLAVRFRYGHRHYRGSILGLESQRSLFRLLDADENPVQLPRSGVVLSDQLASILHVQEGDEIDVEVLEGARPRQSIEVTAIITELAGTSAYMDASEVHRLMHEPRVINGAFLAVDPRMVDELYHRLKETPAIASVAVKHSTVEQFRETVSQNSLLMQSFTLFFATVIAAGVVYNTARISLDERGRELATLRVIGFTRREVSVLLLGELTVLTIVAIPIGWLLGTGFCWAMVVAFESENFRIPLVIERATLVRAGLVAGIAAVVSGFLIRRRLDRLDLVEVLKSR